MMLFNYRPRAIRLCLPTLPPPRWSRLWKIATLFGVIVLVMLIAVPVASAWQPHLVANLDCYGRVTFTVTADIQNSTRDNANVAVIDTSGGAQPISTGVFNAANNWSFSGSYTIPTTVTSDTLTPQAGVWSNGTEASNGPSATVTRPSSCPTITTALSSSTIVAGGSAYDSATLSGATTDAGGTVTYTLYADSSCSTLSTVPALNETVNVDNGAIPHTSAVTFANAGTYYWQAVYSGDNSNGAATSPCTSEPLSVTAPPQPSPQPTTAPAATSPTATPATATPATATPATATPATATPPSSPGSPGITITKSPDTQTIVSGATATFTIVVTNAGGVTLTNVFVTDALSPSCAQTSSTIAELATMLPGASVTYTCRAANVTASFTNVATDTGTPPSGPDVTATDTATVLVTASFTPPIPSVTRKPPKGGTQTPSTPGTQTPPAPGTQTPPTPGTQTPPAGGSDFETGKTAAPFTPPIVTTTHPPGPRPKLVSHVPPTTAG